MHNDCISSHLPEGMSQCTHIPFLSFYCTDKKENQVFLIYKEILSGAVAKSYMTNVLLIYEFRASREKVVPPPPLCSLVLSPHTARGRVM